jgi:hypothetical protein
VNPYDFWKVKSALIKPVYNITELIVFHLVTVVL